MNNLILLSLCSLIIVAFGLQSDSRVTLFRRLGHPEGWNQVGRADPNEKKEFFIAMKQTNEYLLEKILYDVSHPKSPLYGQHWTYDQIMEVIAPSPTDVETIIKWLMKEGVKDYEIKSRGDSLIVKTSVSIVESLFQTEMNVFVNSKTGRRILAHMGEMSVPLEISSLVDMITALSFFPPPRKIHEREEPSVPGPQTVPWLVPSHLRKVYNVPLDLRATNPLTTQAAVEFEWPGCFNYSDMEVYQEVVGFPFTNVSRIIPENEWVDSGCDGESALDLQMMLTMGSGANTAYFTNEYWIYEFAVTLTGLENPPLVTSLSWGWMEADSCQIGSVYCSQFGIDSQVYVNRSNTELKKAGIMGLTVIVCTQDEGAPSDNNMDCSLDNTDTPVWPIYPASSPWVTAVGSTTIYNSKTPSTRNINDDNNNHNSNNHYDDNNDDLEGRYKPICEIIICNNGTDEKVASSADNDTEFTSGGGFSNWTARPSYQDSAVKSYLASDGIRPPTGTWNPNNRGYPDISTAGCEVFNIQGGSWGWEGGTSMSTPLFSGMVSLLNDWRLNNGKKPLGFLNYLLYEMGTEYPQAYNYITVGNNTCTGWFMDTCCKYGYSAVAGWNPAVGFGTPNFEQILAYVQKLN